MTNNRNSGILRRENKDILNAIRNEASTDYQRRVPQATQANIAETFQRMLSFRPTWNEFVDSLVNRIGTVIVRGMSWTNPLAEFKTAQIMYGDTIEEVQAGLIRAKTYSPERDYLEREVFGRHDIDVASAFHKVNRQEYYPITVNEDILRRAFTEQNGLSSFVSSLLSAPTTSDNWDEFILTTSLFREYEKNDGFHHVRVPDLRTLTASEADAKSALKRVRAIADTIIFPSSRYNAAHMPTFAAREDMVLFATPNFVANIDVDALAAAFNLDRAQVPTRIITIPEEHFVEAGCQAILTTTDFFVIADTLLENTSQYNPVSLSTNYFLHHHSIISASRFIPAVMFHSEKDDEVIYVTPSDVKISALTIINSEGETVTEVVPGNDYDVDVTITGKNIDGTEIGIDFDIEGASSDSTRVSNDGTFHLSKTEKATTIKVTATVTYRDPAKPAETPSSATATVTVKVAPTAAG